MAGQGSDLQRVVQQCHVSGGRGESFLSFVQSFCPEPDVTLASYVADEMATGGIGASPITPVSACV